MTNERVMMTSRMNNTRIAPVEVQRLPTPAPQPTPAPAYVMFVSSPRSGLLSFYVEGRIWRGWVPQTHGLNSTRALKSDRVPLLHIALKIRGGIVTMQVL